MRFIHGVKSKLDGSLPFTIIYSKKSGLVIDFWEGKKSENLGLNLNNIAINS